MTEWIAAHLIVQQKTKPPSLHLAHIHYGVPEDKVGAVEAAQAEPEVGVPGSLYSDILVNPGGLGS